MLDERVATSHENLTAVIGGAMHGLWEWRDMETQYTKDTTDEEAQLPC